MEEGIEEGKCRGERWRERGEHDDRKGMERR